MITSEKLINELHALGLYLIKGEVSVTLQSPQLSEENLLIGLAEHKDARLRMTMIALFLYRPEIAGLVPDELDDLKISDRKTLKLFYTSAVLLQRIHKDRLREFVSDWKELPDYFSEELGIPTAGSPQDRLRFLGKRHRELTGKAANWLGTYQHAAKRLLARLEKEAAWAA